MHGFCSLNLLQQVLEGAVDDEIAGRHELSCTGLQATALDKRTSPKSIKTATAKTNHRDEPETFFIFKNQLTMKVEMREKKMVRSTNNESENLTTIRKKMVRPERWRVNSAIQIVSRHT